MQRDHAAEPRGHRQRAAEEPEERGALHHDVDVRRAGEPERARELRPLPQRARPALLGPGRAAASETEVQGGSARKGKLETHLVSKRRWFGVSSSSFLAKLLCTNSLSECIWCEVGVAVQRGDATEPFCPPPASAHRGWPAARAVRPRARCGEASFRSAQTRCSQVGPRVPVETQLCKGWRCEKAGVVKRLEQLRGQLGCLPHPNCAEPLTRCQNDATGSRPGHGRQSHRRNPLYLSVLVLYSNYTGDNDSTAEGWACRRRRSSRETAASSSRRRRRRRHRSRAGRATCRGPCLNAPPHHTPH